MTDIVGTIDACISLAERLYQLVSDFKDAPGSARTLFLKSQLSTLRLGLFQGDAQQQALRNKLTKDKENLVKDELRRLKRDLQEAINYLQNNNPDDFFSQLLWAVRTGSIVIKQFNEIESRLVTLQSVFELARIHPDLANLDGDHFTIVTGHEDYNYVRGTPPQVNQYCVRADLVSPDRSDVQQDRPESDVFVESFRPVTQLENDANKRKYDEARRRAKVTAERLWWTRVSDDVAELAFQTGILPCLGYDEFRMIFLLPSNACLKDKKPQTLRDYINSNPARVSLDTRCALALQLADAVFKIHLAGVAHRSIRSNSFLLLRPNQDAQANDTAPPAVAKKDPSLKQDPASSEPPPKEGIMRRITQHFTGGLHDEPKIGITKRITQHFAGTSKHKPAHAPHGPPRRTASKTSLRKKSKKVALVEGIRRRATGFGGKDSGRYNIDPGDDSDADDGVEVANAPTDRRQGNAARTPRCGRVPPGFGAIYLMNWRLANYSGLSFQRPDPGAKSRSMDIYIHPDHQQPKAAKFHMGHDIYSLGVCLLEIGLWESFVREEITTSSDASYGPLTDRAGLKRTLDAGGVKTKIEELAKKELPAAMGEGYATLVQRCLTCTDPSGILQGIDQKKHCARFQERILLPLRNMDVGFRTWSSASS